MRGKETNLPPQKSSKQCMWVLPLQEVGLTSQLHVSLLWTWTAYSDLLPKNRVKKGVTSTSTVENLGKHCLNQGMANVPRDVIWLSCTPIMMPWEEPFTSVIFNPKNHSPRLVMRKASDKQRLRSHPTGYLADTSWDCEGRKIQRKTEKPSQIRGDWETWWQQAR